MYGWDLEGGRVYVCDPKKALRSTWRRLTRRPIVAFLRSSSNQSTHSITRLNRSTNYARTTQVYYACDLAAWGRGP